MAEREHPKDRPSALLLAIEHEEDLDPLSSTDGFTLDGALRILAELDEWQTPTAPGYWPGDVEGGVPGLTDVKATGPIGAGTPHARMQALWEEMHKRERAIYDLTGYHPVMNRRTEDAFVQAFDRLTAIAIVAESVVRAADELHWDPQNEVGEAFMGAISSLRLSLPSDTEDKGTLERRWRKTETAASLRSLAMFCERFRRTEDERNGELYGTPVYALVNELVKGIAQYEGRDMGDVARELHEQIEAEDE